jgi:hypothetical protein
MDISFRRAYNVAKIYAEINIVVHSIPLSTFRLTNKTHFRSVRRQDSSIKCGLMLMSMKPLLEKT